ncbi:hypothetical protein [Allomuricauda sp. CP2A]|uniref:hypothetical protein n=1 Tax=Allomuricauda sp. CP2A TaxID=1848189 RepID=UPI001146CAD3|nr:hypothetical protein [Muricauda sp. CP2A]
MERHGNIFFFVGRGRKGQAAFPPLGLSGGREGVGQNWNGKTTESGRSKVARSGGLEWKVCATSAAAWGTYNWW